MQGVARVAVMSHHESPAVQRHCDVVIVGGSAAGLAAALQLVRQRRSVIVVDDGRPRNAAAAHMHSYLGRDGSAPAELVDAGRAEVRSYGGEILSGHVERVTRTADDRFVIDMSGEHSIVARRVIAASGIVDELPDIEGLAERWGREVIHCPFCHGFEVRDRRIVQIVTHPMGLHPAPLFRQLTDRLTVLLHDGVQVDRSEVDRLRAAGVDVRSVVVRRILGGGSDGSPVAAPARDATAGSGRRDTAGPAEIPVMAVELADGERIDADAVAIGPRCGPRIEAFAALGLQAVAHPSGLGRVVHTDGAGATSVAGLFAAGNLVDPSQQVLQAAADGARVGGMVAFSLADQDVRAASRPSGNETDWDHRYSGEPMWSGNPNGTVVAEAGDLTPGRALDVGAGEGGDALWLAERGWVVTAADISGRALDRVHRVAEQRGLVVECLRADANGSNPFPVAAFDLVSASYASIPRTPDGRGVAAIVSAVAPGGTLLVVGHDLAPMRADVEAGHGQAFDPAAYVTDDDFAAVLGNSPDWTIQVHATRPRPAGAVSTHHVDDVVFRARRSH